MALVEVGALLGQGDPSQGELGQGDLAHPDLDLEVLDVT